MLIEKGISYEPAKVPVIFRGQTIELMIRPLDADAQEACRDKATVYRWAENPQTEGRAKASRKLLFGSSSLRLMNITSSNT